MIPIRSFPVTARPSRAHVLSGPLTASMSSWLDSMTQDKFCDRYLRCRQETLVHACSVQIR